MNSIPICVYKVLCVFVKKISVWGMNSIAIRVYKVCLQRNVPSCTKMSFVYVVWDVRKATSTTLMWKSLKIKRPSIQQFRFICFVRCKDCDMETMN